MVNVKGCYAKEYSIIHGPAVLWGFTELKVRVRNFGLGNSNPQYTSSANKDAGYLISGDVELTVAFENHELSLSSGINEKVLENRVN